MSTDPFLVTGVVTACFRKPSDPAIVVYAAATAVVCDMLLVHASGGHTYSSLFTLLLLVRCVCVCVLYPAAH